MSGPPRLTTHSEVATIKYLQANTSIPIPQILDWSDDRANAIGTEYIIMEHAAGVHLHQRWPTMTGDQRIKFMDSIYRKMRETVDFKLPAYGSIYQNNGPIESSLRIPLDGLFCIGPHIGTRYWDCNTGESRYHHIKSPDPGPWAIEDHIQLLESGRDVLKKMAQAAQIQGAAAPVLFHPDLHKRNIFVSEDDPTVITATIDWQSSNFVPHNPHSSVENELEPDEQHYVKAFNVCSLYLVPKVTKPRLLDEGLLRPFRYCHRTWRDGAVAFRHELIETSKHWSDLGLEGSCPFPLPTASDLAAHQKEYRMFEAAQELKSNVSILLNTASDGWVPVEDFEATEIAHKELFEAMLEAVLTNENPGDDEPIQSEGDLKAIWPFDLS
ncbi:MAG: hypothetical protein M1819_004219 [Sarea resinae]|nr:MAG: hypothetical protein M1819_004219 [Sarea resinae]